ncbi:hypothetical protein NDU88_002774 [Pleurodeles waltl]|uniref:Uncharacterized protein n=1 Tax=Pleurodeles waltl TaxID=8319 RepID=A0AAV7UWK6_PLEWA|nr:hypothetical protein NDU88_002774 [Pleurodeles waltl]
MVTSVESHPDSPLICIRFRASGRNAEPRSPTSVALTNLKWRQADFDTPASQTGPLRPTSNPEHKGKRDRHSALAPCRRKAEKRVARPAHDRTGKKRAAPCSERCAPPSLRRESPDRAPEPRGSLPRPGRRTRGK